MTISTLSVTNFKAHCLEVIRQVEKDGAGVDIVRRGKVVARLMPTAAAPQGTPVWQRLRGHGVLAVAPGDSVLDEGEFVAMSVTAR